MAEFLRILTYLLTFILKIKVNFNNISFNLKIKVNFNRQIWRHRFKDIEQKPLITGDYSTGNLQT